MDYKFLINKKFLLITLILVFLMMSFVFPDSVFAGGGYVEEGNNDLDIPHKLNLNVLFLYDATPPNVEGWRDAFNEASKLLYNSTEGKMQIGTVNVYINDLSAQDFADIWISEENGRASARVGGLEGEGKILLYQNDKK